MYIRNIKLIFIIFWGLFFLTCSTDNGYKPHLMKPIAKKNYHEILFALDKKYWKSDLGKTIKRSFEKLVKTTPLPYEKEFDTDFIVPNKILKNIKNNNCFIFVQIENYNSKNISPVIKKDFWANGQLIIELKFNSEKAAINYFKYKNSEVKSILKKFNLSKIQKKFSEKNSINKELVKSIDLKFKGPDGIKINKKAKNFWWWSKLEIQKDQNGSHEIQKGIVLYQEDYKNKNQFEKSKILSVKDSVGEAYLTGKRDNSFMKTVENEISKTIDTSYFINNKYVKQIKGCWRMENDKMGGPFISYSWLNSKKTKIITAQGYIYAPNFEKSKYLLELEAIIVSGIK
tara:strand:- start:4406 stop:5434 length:1029 start_codon:yes stop_codon:yes gene_type:complete